MVTCRGGHLVLGPTSVGPRAPSSSLPPGTIAKRQAPRLILSLCLPGECFETFCMADPLRGTTLPGNCLENQGQGPCSAGRAMQHCLLGEHSREPLRAGKPPHPSTPPSMKQPLPSWGLQTADPRHLLFRSLAIRTGFSLPRLPGQKPPPVPTHTMMPEK